MRSRALALLVVCGGGCGDNLTAVPGDLAWTDRLTTISGNEDATCAIDTAGALYCWGVLEGLPGEAGTGNLGAAGTGLPARFGNETWREIAVGPSHACAIRDDGSLWCWGANCGGQLGDGTHTSRAEPIQVGTPARWRHVTVGGGHSCAIDEAGVLACWGGLDYGQSDCANIATERPMQVEGTWTAVSSSWYATHGLRADGTLWRWHDRELPSTTDPFEPPVQLGRSRWRAIASGLGGVYGVRDDGKLVYVAFSTDDEVQLGGGDDWSDAIAGRDHACAIKQDGSLWCWGRNDLGQLGTGSSSEDVPVPAQLTTNTWTAVTAGYGHSCGVSEHEVHCWGTNGTGQLGLGMPYDRELHTPMPIQSELRVE